MHNARNHLYGKRFGRVLDFIDKNLEAELSIEQLAQVANFSIFHFHRQFTHYLGVTPSRYVSLARIRRAFKRAIGQSPSSFRKNPEMIAALEHRGDPALLNESVQRFIVWRKESGLSPIASSKTFGIPYHDPATTRAVDFRFDIGGSVSAEVPANGRGVITKRIPGVLPLPQLEEQHTGACVARGRTSAIEMTRMEAAGTDVVGRLRRLRGSRRIPQQVLSRIFRRSPRD